MNIREKNTSNLFFFHQTFLTLKKIQVETGKKKKAQNTTLHCLQWGKKNNGVTQKEQKREGKHI